jgi:hypothetical protein
VLEEGRRRLHLSLGTPLLMWRNCITRIRNLSGTIGAVQVDP